MAYIEEKCIAGSVVTIRKYYTFKHKCKGEKREKRSHLTSEAQKKVNIRIAERNLAALMNSNFTDDTGMLVTFTYKKDLRPPTSDVMQKDMRQFLKKLRTQFKKLDVPLKYIYVKELGKKGGAHIHMLMSACDVRLLRDCWTSGYVRIDPLWSDGDYTNIARYFIKYTQKTEETEGCLVGRRWNSSKNLCKPKIIKKAVNSNTFSTKVRKSTISKYQRNGFTFVADEEYEGYTIFGFKYYECKFRKTQYSEHEGRR